MKHTLLGTIALTVCLLASTTFAGDFPDSWFYNGVKQEQFAKIIGKPMPKLQLKRWINGDVKEADLKGKIVVLDIWATWCAPCIKALPHTNKLHEAYKDKGVVVLAICGSGAEDGKYEAAVKKASLTVHTAVPVNEDRFQKEWSVAFWPTYVIIDQKGIVRAAGLTPSHLEDAVKKLLAEATPDQASSKDASKEKPKDNAQEKKDAADKTEDKKAK
jgi:thiol-disulfide isomerase/thioredoxin